MKKMSTIYHFFPFEKQRRRVYFQINSSSLIRTVKNTYKYFMVSQYQYYCPNSFIGTHLKIGNILLFLIDKEKDAD